SFPLRILIVTVARQNVQAYGRIQIRRSCPEFIIVVRIKRKIRMWRLPDNGAFESGLVTALQLFNADIYVIDRDGWNTDQPTRVDAAVFDQPIVVDAEKGLLHSSIVEGEKIQHQGRVAQ